MCGNSCIAFYGVDFTHLNNDWHYCIGEMCYYLELF
jgi:hypothetical protein